jgi:branched-chain amino acid transport system substrate-binding protein
MCKLVILEIGEGNFEYGFPVSLKIGDDDFREDIRVVGRLPAFPEISEQYARWRKAYLSLDNLHCRITVSPITTANISINHIKQDLYWIGDNINTWLSSKEFNCVKEQLLTNLNSSDEIRILIQTNNYELLSLPWHLWNFLDSYPKAEIALSNPTYGYAENVKNLGKHNFKNPVKILSIIGNSSGISVREDLDFLENLPGANVSVLVEPNRKLIHDMLWQQDWDILFFAGHSSSGSDDTPAYIYINETDKLTIPELKFGLKNAISRGLQLAIFNSCDGLKLAKNLADLNMPQLIVMRELVPDLVAQQFLKYFLDAFSHGKSLYLSVRESRERLQILEDKFPCASLLPVIFQNPIILPPTWKNNNHLHPIFRYFSKSKPILSGYMLLILMLGATLVNLVSLKVGNQQSQTYVEDRISLGEKTLINSVNLDTNTDDKKQGLKAFASKDFKTASEYFQKSLQWNRNDPETLIYLNNAKIGKSSTLKIGVVIPINSSPDVAQDILRGVAHAQNEINNKGGIKEKPLQVEIANDDNNPEIAKQIATKLVEDPDILAVIGHASSQTSIIATSVYGSGKLVMISPTSTSESLSNINKFFFRTIPSNSFMANTLANTVIKSDHKTIAICNDDSSEYNKYSFKQALVFAIISRGVKVINIDCNLSESDLNPSKTIYQAINNRADSLLLAPSVGNIDKALEIAKANKGRLALFGNNVLYNKKTLRLGQESVRNLVLVVPWYPKTFSKNTFIENSNQLWGEPVNWRTAMTYDATQVIIKGLMESNSRDSLQKVLSSPNFSVNGATGKIQFISGDRQKPATLVKIVQNNQSDSGYEFVSISDNSN